MKFRRIREVLLLLGLLSLLLGLGSLLPRAHVPRLSPQIPQLGVRRLLALGHVSLLHLAEAVLQAHPTVQRQGILDGLGDLAVLVAVGRLRAGELDVLLGRVEFLELAGLAGEEDEAGLVGLEALDVEGQGFFVGVLAARVDGDADCGSEFAGDTGFL
jgi:hypothetical protein